MMLRLLALLLALTALPTPGSADISGWVDNPGGRVRLIVLPPDPQGRVEGAVEIEPAAGWITYWREPGEAGVPPQLQFLPESGLALEALDFPAPRTFRQNGVSDIGYDQAVSLPFRAKAEGAAERLKATLFIGICKDICVPFQASFDVAFSGGEAEAQAAIAAAKAALPEAPSDSFHAGKPVLSSDGRTVKVPLTLPSADVPTLYLTGPEGYVYIDPVLGRAADGSVEATFTLGELPRNYDPHGKTWRLTAKAGGRAMETPLVFD